MNDDSGQSGREEALSRAEVLRLGMDRVKRSGAAAAGLAIGQLTSRLTPHVQRPPGALEELEFLMTCTRCDACIDACPPGAIFRLTEGAGVAAGTPFLDVDRFKPCTACEDVPCAQACPTGALQVIPIADAWMGTAVLNRDTCRTWSHQPCVSCLRICPVGEAAVLADEKGRVHIDPRGCIGCGLCVAVCPTKPKSIEVEPPSNW